MFHLKLEQSADMKKRNDYDYNYDKSTGKGTACIPKQHMVAKSLDKTKSKVKKVIIYLGHSDSVCHSDTLWLPWLQWQTFVNMS